MQATINRDSRLPKEPRRYLLGTISPAFVLAMTSLVTDSSAINAHAQTRSGVKRATPPARLIPAGTQLRLRLNDTISSKEVRIGDRFTAEVVSPTRYESATVTGHVSSLNKSGRVKGQTRMGFAFDSVTLRNGRTGVLRGQLIRVYESDSVKTVDEEGNVESGGRGKQTLKRTGIGAAAGAVVGGIVGGGKGAAIGLIVGGAAGAGSVAVTGSKELRLEPGTEMLVKVTAR